MGDSISNNNFVAGRTDEVVPVETLNTRYVNLSGDTMTGVLTIQDNLNVLGDLFVSGTTVSLTAEHVRTTDNIIRLNDGEVGAGVTSLSAGIEVDRGSLTNYEFLFDETTDTFRIGEVGTLQAVATREDSPTDNGIAYWDSASLIFKTDGPTWDGSIFSISSGQLTTGGDIRVETASQPSIFLKRSDAILTGQIVSVIKTGSVVDGLERRWIESLATENWSASACGYKTQFRTTPNGTTSQTLAITIDQDQTVLTETHLYSNGRIESDNDIYLNRTNAGQVNTARRELQSYDSDGDLATLIALDNSSDALIIGEFNTGQGGQTINFNIGNGTIGTIWSQTAYRFNNTNADIDFYIEKDTSGDALFYNAGDDTFTIGSVTTFQDNVDVEGYMAIGNGSALSTQKTLVVDRDFSTTGAGRQIDIIGVITVTSNTNNQFGIDCSPGFVVNTGNTHTHVAGAQFAVPDITVTSGTVTNASTVYIGGGPTEGTNNYALNVNSGNVRMNGLPTSSAGLPGGTLWNNSGVVNIV